MLLLSKGHRQQYYRFERLKRKPLEPLDFCNRWIPKLYNVQPDERGYKAACIRELEKITGTQYTTIERNWGADFSNRPEWVPRILKREHLLNLIQQAMNLRTEQIEDLDT